VNWEHGVSGYGNHHCRCDTCRAAWAAYHKAGGYQKRYRDRLRAAGLRANSSFTSPVPRKNQGN
jgi:hypothetical protein